ncbi:MAG TPA: hypothetical protein PKE62_07040 [Anaerolineales bacterium]|nr:hypothetical protein [Anaerolineales bacterium]
MTASTFHNKRVFQSALAGFVRIARTFTSVRAESSRNKLHKP